MTKVRNIHSVVNLATEEKVSEKSLSGTCEKFLATIWALLQLKDLRASQWEEPYIKVNTKELNRELSTRLSTLYTKLSWSMLLLF